MVIYCAKGKHHRAERRKIAKSIKKNTTRKSRRIVVKNFQKSKRFSLMKTGVSLRL